MPDIAWNFLHRASAILVRRNLRLRVEGAENVPKTGSVILAARHVHHLYDGVAIVATIPRPVHILVGLDWAANPLTRIGMTRLCNISRWPIVYRSDSPTPRSPRETTRQTRTALTETLGLLEEDRILLVFPEGYPNIDPGYTPKSGLDDWLPFQPGVLRIATMAATRGLTVPIIPVGFSYEQDDKWTVTLRFGEPFTVLNRRQASATLQSLQERVHDLSTPIQT